MNLDRAGGGGGDAEEAGACTAFHSLARRLRCASTLLETVPSCDVGNGGVDSGEHGDGCIRRRVMGPEGGRSASSASQSGRLRGRRTRSGT